MKHRLPFLLSLLLAVGAAACGGDDATCRIADNGDGTRTIACPGADPVRVVDGRSDAVCTLHVIDEHTKTIQCSDGTFVEIVDGHPVFPGSGEVTGVVQLFGKADHSGVRITVEDDDVDVEFVTEADGAYSLTLPAGIHVLRFEKEGWMPVRVGNIPVINDTWRVAPVVMRLARRIGDVRDRVTVAPGSDAVLIYGAHSIHEGGWLWLEELEPTLAPTRVRLGSYVTSYAFSPDGRQVLYNERTAIDGPLAIFDRETGATELVSPRARGGWFAEGGASVIFETRADVDGACTLHLWSRADGYVGELAPCARFDDQPNTGRGEAVAAVSGRWFVYRTEDRELVARDLEGRVSIPIGEEAADATFGFEFLESGPYLLVRIDRSPSVGRELRLVDLGAGENRLLSRESVAQTRVAPGGGAIFFLEDRDPESAGTFEPVLHLVESGRSLVIGVDESSVQGSFSRDGSRLLLQGVRTHVVDLGTPENLRTFPTAVLRAAFAFDGRVVVHLASSAALQLWDPLADTIEELDPMVAQWAVNDTETRVASLDAGGGLQIADLETGARHRLAATDAVSALVWERDGDGVFFHVPRDEDALELVRWDGAGEPTVLARSQHLGFPRPGPLGFSLFEKFGASGTELFLHRTDTMEVDAVDVPAVGAHFDREVLIYFIDDPSREERNGIYAFRLVRRTDGG